MLSPKCQTRAPSAGCSPSSSSPSPSSTSPASPSPSTWVQPPERWGSEWKSMIDFGQIKMILKHNHQKGEIFNTQLPSLVLKKIPLVAKSIWKYRINLINDRFWTLSAPWSFGWLPSSSTMPSGVSSQFSYYRYEVVVADNAPWLSWTTDTTRWTTNAE